MRLDLQFTKTGRKFRLWYFVLAAAVLGLVCALLPERIGIPIGFGFICLCVVTIVVSLGLLVAQKMRGK